jgi:SAM-dependent methyltransferase
MNPDFREDLAENFELAQKLAPLYCAACDGYHLERTRRRYLSGGLEPLDQLELIDVLAETLARITDRKGSKIGVLIAGSADTSLVSISCVAAERFLSGTARLIDFTVIDKCRTPLQLCENFARRNQLQITASAMDLSLDGLDTKADVVIVHSLLRFLPAARHKRVMQSFRTCLNPGGVIIFSHRLFEQTPEQSHSKSEYANVGELTELFHDAGLVIRSFQQIESEPHSNPKKIRVLFLLEAAINA